MPYPLQIPEQPIRRASALAGKTNVGGRIKFAVLPSGIGRPFPNELAADTVCDGDRLLEALRSPYRLDPSHRTAYALTEAAVVSRIVPMDEEQLKRAHQTVIDGLGSPRNLTMFGHVCLFAGKDAETARNTTATLMEGFIALEGLHLLVNRLGEGESAGIALTNPPDRTGYRVTERATQLLQLTVGAMHQVQSAFEFERPDEAL